MITFFGLIFIFLILLLMSLVFCLSVCLSFCLCITCVQHPWRPEEGIKSSRTGVSDTCEPSWRHWKSNLGPLEQQMLWTTETSFLYYIFYLLILCMESVWVKEQLLGKLTTLLLLNGSWGSKPGHQTWEQASSPAKPCHQPSMTFLDNLKFSSILHI